MALAEILQVIESSCRYVFIFIILSAKCFRMIFFLLNQKNIIYYE
jgi:hypothetical protein